MSGGRGPRTDARTGEGIGKSRLSRLLSRSPKRSSLVAGEIRSWIITRGLGPGDTLPNEKAMIESFGVSRATIREALKELEVQGLVRMKTGPNGGPVVAGSGSQEALQAIQNFCYFEKVTIDDIYELRTFFEVRLVRSVVGHVDEATFLRLEELAALSAAPAEDQETRRRQREAEFEFHTTIAGRSPNPLLKMMIDVLAGILVNATARDSSRHHMHCEWSHENGRYHAEIVAALRRGDGEAAAALMEEHMGQAHRQLQLVYGDVSLEDIALGRQDAD
ncbi:FadR/GntR family transcriptional regulator [Lutibaculum baratangense]|nr:FCD domain-containing protein [Lutibaculum baratangense]